ncbi:SHOCT domain-containing protein [Candidatus Pseudothioglobus sp. Uisw_086]|uniref:SHOCT domain-containing protein n=1 Tax=Candidatus Pseudothioglobus sp. Uisw_086 TaxID=3230998 RepID=UPI003A846E28
MKRLLLLLILSFLSTAGYSGTSYAPEDSSEDPPAPPPSKNCPDGGEPTKSISDDGFYFVYTCGGVPPVPIVSPEAKVSSETAADKSTPGDLGEDDYISKIKEVKALLDSGIISEEQFEQMTQKIIDNI